MNKIKTLQILSGLLLLINIGLILFMVLKKGPRRRHKEGLEKHMQKVFEFNDDQMNKFIDYRDLHRERGEEISKQLLAVSKSYYILDENNLKYNIKLGFHYAIKDRRSLGVRF